MSTEPVDGTTEATDAPPSAAATLFDLRTIIAVLFGVYGIVLFFIGLFGTGDSEKAKSGGLNLNLWTGLAMLVVAVLFVAWVLLRPLHPAGPPDDADDRDGDPERSVPGG